MCGSAAAVGSTRMDIGSVLRETGETFADVRPLVVIGWAVPCAAAAAWVTCYPRHRKVVLSALALAGTLAFLILVCNRRVREYYEYVDEVMANPGVWRGRHLQVHGNVVEGSIERAVGTTRYRFAIESREPRPYAVLRATYTGVLPDLFRSCALVIAKGELTADGVLEVVPDGLLTKCCTKGTDLSRDPCDRR